MKYRILRLVLLLSIASIATIALLKHSAVPRDPSPSAKPHEPGAKTAAVNEPGVLKAAEPARQEGTEFDPLVNPYAAGLREPGRSRRTWEPDFLESLAGSAEGAAIRFELTDSRIASGSIQILDYRDGELVYVSGVLTEPEPGKFFFLKPPAGGKAGNAVGIIEFPNSQLAYRLEPTGPDGEPELWQRRLDEVLCISLPRPEAAATDDGRVEEAPPLRPDAREQYIPDYNTNIHGTKIVSLQSNPGSQAVFLLDFFGGYTPTWGGVNYVVPAAANNSTIRDLWKRVAEDFMPFNINVTTDIRVYQAAPADSRQRCCFTDTPVTAAGVAYFGSWNWGNDTPCWSVYTTGKSGAEVAAHEGGHTLGLSHDTQKVPDGSGGTNHVEYYGGHGSGSTGWAPTMGVGYYQPVSTWSKGEYQYAANLENDLQVITTVNNNVAYRTDDTGSTLVSSRYLEVFDDNSVFAEGVIERSNDTDAFQFTTSTGGRVALAAYPVGDWSCLAVSVVLTDSGGVVIASNNPQTTISAAIAANVPAGTYVFRVTGAGRNNPLTTGFTSYGSLGYYSIAGSVAGARQPTRLEVAEHSPSGTVVGIIPAADTNGTLAYIIASGNSNNTFAVDSLGVVTVANNTLLDYDRLASNSVRAVQFELMVHIQNLTDPLKTEMNRRVLIDVLNAEANQPLAVTGFNAGVIVPWNATAAGPQATAFDLANNWAFYQAGLSGNLQVGGTGGTQGLPAGRRFASLHDKTVFQLGPYGAPNALLLGRNYPPWGTLTLTQPRPFNSLAILASSANGGGVGTLVLHFTDGTRSPVFQFNAQDWYNTTANVALQGFGRVRLGQATLSTENPGFTNPNFYQTTLNLAAFGLNKTVSAITFTNPPVGGNQSAGIFAVSGREMPPEVVITQQPRSVTNNMPSQPSTFHVIAMGAPTLGCQWYKGTPPGGSLLPGRTSTNLTFSPVNLTDAGSYYVVVTNSLGAVTSSVATLTVYRAPVIARQPSPTNLWLFTGRSNLFSAEVNGALPLFYQWRFNGVAIPGATGSNYLLGNVQLTHSGSYALVAYNAYGSVTSSVVSLAVHPPNYPLAQRILADKPLGYWRLDETNGTVAHDYVSGWNGAYTNTLLGQPGYRLIDTHRAARFGVLASANSYVGDIPINFASPSNAAFSVEAWVNGGAQSTDAGLITKGAGSGGEQFNLDCGAPNRAFRFFVREAGGQARLANSSVVPNNQWHHLVGVCDQANGRVILYVNGVSNASSSITVNGGLLSSSSPVTFGSRQSGVGTPYNFQFVGSMEEVAIYNYALSPAQVQAHYVAASNRAPAFVSNPFTNAPAHAGQPYSSTISTNASDPNGDVITFQKISGPEWLSVAASGAVSGTPFSAQAGTNSFLVRVTDAFGLTGNATMNLFVVPAAAITNSASLEGGMLTLQWSGGIGPFEVQMTTNLVSPVWETIATGLNEPTLLVTPTNASGFYRILGR